MLTKLEISGAPGRVRELLLGQSRGQISSNVWDQTWWRIGATVCVKVMENVDSHTWWQLEENVEGLNAY